MLPGSLGRFESLKPEHMPIQLLRRIVSNIRWIIT